MDIVNKIVANKDELATIVSMVIAVASAVSALTPTPKDDGIIKKIHSVFIKIVDFFALNILNAK